MILSKTIDVTISNNGRHYQKLGYKCRQGDTLTVPIEHLPPQSNKRLICQCDDCGVEFVRGYQLLNKKPTHLCLHCTRILVTPENRKSISKSNQKRLGEKHPRWNPDKAAFQAYAYKCRRVTEATYREHKDLLNPLDLPRTLCGVEGGYQLDHKVSIQTGYRWGINPKIIGSLDNLQLLSWENNRSKW